MRCPHPDHSLGILITVVSEVWTAWGTHIRTVLETCGGSYPLVGGPALQNRSATLQGLEKPRHCSHSCSPLREAARALYFSQLSPWPLRELRFYILCSLSGKPFCVVRGSAGHSWARQPLSSSVWRSTCWALGTTEKEETTNTGGTARRYTGEKAATCCSRALGQHLVSSPWRWKDKVSTWF